MDSHTTSNTISSGRVDSNLLRENFVASKSDPDKLNALLDSVDGWFWEIDRQGRITYSNRRVQSLLGVSPADIIGTSLFDLVSSSEQNAIKESLMSRISFNQHISSFSFPCINRHGQVIRFDLTANPFLDEQQNSGGYRGICRIAEFNSFKESFASNPGMIFEQLIEAVVFIDRDLKIRFANQSFYRMFGYSESETIGKNLLSLSPEGQKSGIQSDALIVDLKEKGVWQGEVRRMTKAGEYIPVMINAKAVYNRAGKFQGYIGTYLDLREIRTSNISIRKGLKDLVFTLARLFESLHPDKEGHQYRVAQLSLAIARDLGKDIHFTEGLAIGAAFHDIGYLLLPDELKDASGNPVGRETELLRSHTLQGYKVLRNLNLPWPVDEMVYQHHEHLDGSGFPNQLRGSEIIEEARILAVADFVVTRYCETPGNMSFSLESILKELEDNAGSHYDEIVVESCCRLIKSKEFVLEPDVGK